MSVLTCFKLTYDVYVRNRAHTTSHVDIARY